MSSAGRFRIDVWGPWPCWINVYCDKELVAKFAHTELSDLQYAINKAVQEVKQKLPRDHWHEVEGAP